MRVPQAVVLSMMPSEHPRHSPQYLAGVTHDATPRCVLFWNPAQEYYSALVTRSKRKKPPDAVLQAQKRLSAAPKHKFGLAALHLHVKAFVEVG